MVLFRDTEGAPHAAQIHPTSNVRRSDECDEC